MGLTPRLRALLATTLLATGIAACGVGRLSVTCSIPDPDPCEDTALNSEWEGLPSTPTLVEVLPVPSHWAESRDKQFRATAFAANDPAAEGIEGWAARAELEDGRSIIAACVYSSDDEVYCDADESPTPVQTPVSGPDG